jgi:hypothetical protein
VVNIIDAATASLVSARVEASRIENENLLVYARAVSVRILTA